MANLGPIPSYSPAVNFREVDLTGSIAQEPPGGAAIVGNFRWGPVGVPTLVYNEDELVATFATPDAVNTIDFHDAAYFLRYAEALYVVREVDGDSAADATASNAYSQDSATASDLLIKNKKHFEAQADTLDNYEADSVGVVTLRGHELIARYPGTLGNSIEVQVCPVTAFDSDLGVTTDSAFDNWAYKASFPGAPGTSPYAAARDGLHDELHVIVIDKNGALTGTKGAILETWPYLSAASDAKTVDGNTNYVKDVINEKSQYIYWASAGSPLAADSDEWGLRANIGTTLTPGTSKNFLNGLSTKTFEFAGGTNSTALGTADYLRGMDELDDPDTTAFGLMIVPGMSASDDQVTVTNYAVNIAQTRKDFLVVSSTHRSGVVGVTSPATITTNIKTCADFFTNSSYLAIAGNYLKVFDKYNDQYIVVPAAASVAGIMAATDRNAAPWFSPAGTRRGQLLGVTELLYNPNKAQRDTLYKADVNPIVNLVGQGTLLYGDKTALGRPSAFDRINVRRLFLTIERDIVRFSKDILFEFNDEFTRAEFTALTEQYLRNVQAGRGIYDFRVICDETNNTPAIIDANQFIASFFIKPARSINFITLNFVAVRTGASFDEVVGTLS